MALTYSELGGSLGKDVLKTLDLHRGLKAELQLAGRGGAVPAEGIP